MEEKVNGIIEILKTRYPDPTCALHYKKDYELMISVRLAAQCTDARVNMITPALFSKYPTLEAFAKADIADVERMVHSCGFYKHKARDIFSIQCQHCVDHSLLCNCDICTDQIPECDHSQRKQKKPLSAHNVPFHPSTSFTISI